jgi:hypothetical protein
MEKWADVLNGQLPKEKHNDRDIHRVVLRLALDQGI